MESEFERFRQAASLAANPPLPLGPASVPPPEDQADKAAQSSANISSNATPTPADLVARRNFVIENLGIRQTLLLLEHVYSDEYPSIQPLVAGYKPDKANLQLCSPERPPLTVLDILTHAFGTQEMALEVIIPFLLNNPARDRTAWRPDHYREFPDEALPDVARKVVQKMVEIHSVESLLAALLALAVASAATGKGLNIKTVNSLIAYANLYLVGAGRSGCGKSIVANPFIKILLDFQVHLKRLRKKREATVKARLDAIEKALEALEKGVQAGPAHQTTAPTAETLMLEAAILQSQLSEPRILVDDVTSEKFADLAGKNNGTLASISSDARSAIKNLKGRYRSGDSTDEDILLKGYSVEPIIQDRLSRDSVETIACFSICWLTQPDHLRGLYGKEALTDSGLLCRFLPFMIESRRPPSAYEEVEFPTAIWTPFQARIWELLEKYHQHTGPAYTISATPAARKIIIGYDQWIRDRIEDGEFDWIETYAVRLAEQAWRIALVLHAIEHGNRAHEHSLEEHNAAGAVSIVRWFFAQIQLLFRDARESKGNSSLATARDFVRNRREGITPYDLFRAHQKHFKDATDARATLLTLVEEGAIAVRGNQDKLRFYPRTGPNG